MYVLKADGVVFYDPSSDEMAMQVLSPKVKYELNSAGELTFTILPGNVAFDRLHKLKTIITLEQDGEVIFRGRVLETVTDTYNQKEVYCEGELAYLLDSLVRPYDFNGKAADLFRQLVAKHNEQVEEHKQFTVGMVTAVDNDDDVRTDGEAYTDTMTEIRNMLLNQFGGYLRVRRENDACYLDYVDAFNQTCTQEIRFGVNMVDIEDKVNAQEVCTVLVPLGKKSKTIKDVNGGKDYVEDAEAIEKYGRIIKTHTWGDVSDANELLQLAQEYMEKMKADATLTITAVDLHTCGADVDGIHLGDTVRLVSAPHGMNKEEVCTEIILDIQNPEKSEYTFGLPRQTLTDSSASAISSMSSSISNQHIWLTETEEGLYVAVNNIDLIGHRVSQAEVAVESNSVAISTAQNSIDILGERMSSAELRVDSAEAAISLKAAQTVVNDLGERMSSAELKIDGAESKITLLAEEIELAGYVKADELWSEYLNGADLDAGTIVADSVNSSYISGDSITTDSLGTSELTIGGTDINDLFAAKSHTHSSYAAKNHTHSDYLTTNDVSISNASTSHRFVLTVGSKNRTVPITSHTHTVVIDGVTYTTSSAS